MTEENKTCFVIAPIGPDGSEIRRKSDCCLEYIIKPAFIELGFKKIERIDESDEAGQITPGIIKRILNADWCVADLSGANPNVFYEIGLRHAFQKPIIHISDEIASIPFDNSHQNTIEYIHDDPRSHKACIERIKRQVGQVDESADHFSTPVSLALGAIALDNSGDSRDEILSQLTNKLLSMEQRLGQLDGQLKLHADTVLPSTNAMREIAKAVSEQRAKNDDLIFPTLGRKSVLGNRF